MYDIEIILNRIASSFFLFFVFSLKILFSNEKGTEEMQRDRFEI